LCNISEYRWALNIYRNIKFFETQFLRAIRVSDVESILLCDSNSLPFRIKINLKTLTIVE
jgi:hypothetical protein